MREQNRQIWDLGSFDLLAPQLTPGIVSAPASWGPPVLFCSHTGLVEKKAHALTTHRTLSAKAVLEGGGEKQGRGGCPGGTEGVRSVSAQSCPPLRPTEGNGSASWPGPSPAFQNEFPSAPWGEHRPVRPLPQHFSWILPSLSSPGPHPSACLHIGALLSVHAGPGTCGPDSEYSSKPFFP